MEWDTVIKIKIENTIAKIKEAGRSGTEVDILAPFTEIATGIIAEICLGDSFKTNASRFLSSRFGSGTTSPLTLT
jgi:hypothetical protein